MTRADGSPAKPSRRRSGEKALSLLAALVVLAGLSACATHGTTKPRTTSAPPPRVHSHPPAPVVPIPISGSGGSQTQTTAGTIPPLPSAPSLLIPVAGSQGSSGAPPAPAPEQAGPPAPTPAPPPPPVPPGPPAPSVTGPAPFSGHGSIGEAWAVGVKPNAKVLIVNAYGRIAETGQADPQGGVVIRDIQPGSGYTFSEVLGGGVLGTKPFAVLSTSDTPPESFYSSQHMHQGLNYITMRDGVQLAATVRPPEGKTLADGPFPTVIEYSGYSIAAPGNLLQQLIDEFVTHTTDTSSLPVPDSATAVGSILAPLLGFATVSLQMRGTGCSGGAFDLFGLPSIYDGYDAVQIVASQPWVKGHKVGLVGISFSGFSQLYVAGTRPPGLAAIAPLSVTNDLYATGFPGGMLNNGFAARWLASRVHDAQAAPNGQPWANTMIQLGDKQCLANQDLHGEAMSITTLMRSGGLRTPALFDERAPSYWATKIDVPTFMAGAFQDEETGGQWTSMVGSMSQDRHLFVTMTNGTHVDSLNSAIIPRWIEFLDIFVGDQLPTSAQGSLINTFSPELYQYLTGGAAIGTIPSLLYENEPSVAAARQAFEKGNARVTVLFDNGGGNPPGQMAPEWQATYSTWPPESAVPTTYYLGDSGALSTSAPASGSVSFKPNPSARPAFDLPSGANVWAALPPYDWAPITGTAGVGFISGPLTENVAVVGPSSLNLWVKSTAADTDLQATISEVRPDGEEMFMNTGALRASDRHLDAAASTALSPVPTYLATDASPLPPGQYVEVRIPIMAFAYVFRKGSRIRITISAPGGDRPEWGFDTYQTGGKVTDTIELGGPHPSELVLPVVPGLTPPDPQPACPSLRGQPCRKYVPAANEVPPGAGEAGGTGVTGEAGVVPAAGVSRRRVRDRSDRLLAPVRPSPLPHSLRPHNGRAPLRVQTAASRSSRPYVRYSLRCRPSRPSRSALSIGPPGTAGPQGPNSTPSPLWRRT